MPPRQVTIMEMPDIAMPALSSSAVMVFAASVVVAFLRRRGSRDCHTYCAHRTCYDEQNTDQTGFADIDATFHDDLLLVRMRTSKLILPAAQNAGIESFVVSAAESVPAQKSGAPHTRLAGS
jgi:hypothetical protein